MHGEQNIIIRNYYVLLVFRFMTLSLWAGGFPTFRRNMLLSSSESLSICVDNFTLKMKAKQTSETSGTTRPTTKDQFSEDLRLQPLGCISYL